MFSEYSATKLKINNKKITENIIAFDSLKILLNNFLVDQKDIMMEIRKYFELNDYKNTTYQNVWDPRHA